MQAIDWPVTSPSFQDDFAGRRREAARNSFQQFGPTRAHQSIDADDLAGAHRQRKLVDHRIAGAGGVGDRQPLDRKGDIAHLITRRRRAKVEIVADHGRTIHSRSMSLRSAYAVIAPSRSTTAWLVICSASSRWCEI